MGKKDDTEFFTETVLDESDYVRPVSDITRYRIGDAVRKTQSSVIEEFKKVHGDRYDYSKVDYVDGNTKVTIICPDHGEFTQKPTYHKGGSHCPKCVGNYTHSTEELISQFRKVHGDRYDYSKFSGQNNKSKKITIICPDHGEFKQTISAHRVGQDCPKCGRLKRSRNQLEKRKKSIVEEFRKYHGDRYDYSKVDYQGTRTEVIIICPDHGEFSRKPMYHKNGSGCPKCSGKNSRETFLEGFRDVHGDRYDYSKVDYQGAKTKVTIICPDHGEFQQSPLNHKSGKGCRRCAASLNAKKQVRKPISLDVVIGTFQGVHGDKYDYSKVEYVNNATKVTIICPDHGEFQQTPASHKGGHGCAQCNRTKSQSEVIRDFKGVHGDRYDYSKVEYVSASTKVTITCPDHGEFQQTPSSHLSGNGCPECGRISRKIKIGIALKGRIAPNKFSLERVIQEFKNAHGDRYDYSKVDYQSAQTKVTIICPDHGEFQQTPSSHKRGQGCRKCGMLRRRGRKTPPRTS